MSAMHDAVHGAQSEWGAFVGATIVVAVAVAAIALLAARSSGRLSSRSRHFLLLLALAVPGVGLALIPTEAGAWLRDLTAVPDGAAPPLDLDATIEGLEFASIEPTGWAGEWACAAFALWAGGFALLGLWRAAEWARWRSLVHAGDGLVDPRVRTAFEHACDVSGRRARFAVSASCATPMVAGILRPSVVVPAGYGRGMAVEEIESVFLHELEHVARHDNLTAALTELIGAAFWFDPVHWAARRRLVELREAACDEGVLARGCGPDAYVTALAKTCRAAVSPAVACMADLNIRERMDSIMTYPNLRSRWIRESAVRVTGIVALALAGLGIAVFAPPVSAAADSGQHRLHVTTRPGPDGMIYLEGEVRNAEGDLAMAPRATAVAGQSIVMTTQKGDTLYRLTVTAAADGSGLAKLEVLEGETLVDSVLQQLSSFREMERKPAEKITLRLVDADLRDFARALAQLIGKEVSVAAGIEGNITVDVENTPWTEAVAQALEPLGARLAIQNDRVLFVPARKEFARTLSGSLGARVKSIDAPPRAGYERLSPDMTPPRLITRVDPKFTPEARAAKVSGIVIVEALIGVDGLVHDTKILKGLPFGLDQAAVDAVRQWTFTPALRDGEPVPVIFNVTINFKLSDEDPSSEQVRLDIQADRSETGPDGTVRLEGNVRIAVDRT